MTKKIYTDEELRQRNNDASKRYRNRNKEKRIETTKKYRDKNKEKIRESCRNYMRTHKDSSIRARLKTYGLTPEQYNEIFIIQKGCCSICGRHQSEFRKALAVDHDHETGKIRGLLCSNCNAMLGYANDNQQVLLKAVEYLKEKS